MLSDVQIERYCRQVILPEIGSGGQEQLLRSTVSLHGDGDAAFLCASYLAGAGVGTLAVAGFARPGARSRAFGVCDDSSESLVAALSRRNSDCRLARELLDATLVVAIEDSLPSHLSAASSLLWGAASPGSVRLARFAPGQGCLDCLRALAHGETSAEDSGILGALVALEALRLLLGLERPARASFVSIDLVHGTTATSAFPSRPGCARCAQVLWPSEHGPQGRAHGAGSTDDDEGEME
jgi:molybdopterin/thiamine biosynthesis adenylyltransferase